MSNKKRQFINHNDFANWYLLKTMEHGELINASTAAELLGVKMPYIYQLWKEKKISKITYHNKKRKTPRTYYKIKEIMEMVSIKEQIFNDEKDPNKEVVNLNNYPPEANNWHNEYQPNSNGPSMKEYLDFKLKHWIKNNPEKAKTFKKNPIGEFNILTIKKD